MPFLEKIRRELDSTDLTIHDVSCEISQTWNFMNFGASYAYVSDGDVRATLQHKIKLIIFGIKLNYNIKYNVMDIIIIFRASL